MKLLKTVGKKIKELKASRVFCGLSSAFMIWNVQVYASGKTGTESVTSGINILKDFVISIVTAAGVIVLVWGVFDYAAAINQHDTSQQTQGLKKVITGLIMAAAPQIANQLLGK